METALPKKNLNLIVERREVKNLLVNTLGRRFFLVPATALWHIDKERSSR